MTKTLITFFLGGLFALFLTDTPFSHARHGFESKIIRPLKGVLKDNVNKKTTYKNPERQTDVNPHQYFTKAGFGWPVQARKKISSNYGARRGRKKTHKGIDIPAPYDTPIIAAKGGRVIFSGWERSLGNVVVIDHRKGFQTVYGHASKLVVRRDQMVHQGQIIAYVGNTGRSTGPHLHFELRKKGKYHLNPMKYVGVN